MTGAELRDFRDHDEEHTQPFGPAELRAARGRLGLSQRGLAEQLQVATLTVAHWEQGVQAFPPYLRLALERLAQQAYP